MVAEVTTWTGPDSVTTVLDVDWNASGRYMPEVFHEEDEVPGQDGTRWRSTRFKPHEFTLKCAVVGASEGALRTAVRSLVSTMNPKRGEGTITVASPLGDTRQIRCRVVEGLGLDEQEDLSSPWMQMCVITFHAFDPLWEDVSDTSATYQITAAPLFFPILPVRLTSSQIVADATIVNTGDDDMWPQWTITGPASGISVRNSTTGAVFTLSTVLGTGESLYIDTRPNHKTVRRQDGTNLMADVDITTDMWPLVVGTNACRLEVSGAIVGPSTLSVSYRQRYLSP